MEKLLRLCWQGLQELRATERSVPEEPARKRFRVHRLDERPPYEVYFDGEVFRVEGRLAERWARLSLEERDARAYLLEQLQRTSALKDLRRRGLHPGGLLQLGKWLLAFTDTELQLANP